MDRTSNYRKLSASLRKIPITSLIVCAKCNRPVEVVQEFREMTNTDFHFYVKCHGDYSTVHVNRDFEVRVIQTAPLPDFVWDNTNFGTVYAFDNDRVTKVSIETPVTGKRSIILDGDF